MQKKIAEEFNAKFQSNEPFLDFLVLICIDGVADCLSFHDIDYDNIILEIKENINSHSDLMSFFVNIILQAEKISQKSIMSSSELRNLFPQYCILNILPTFLWAKMGV